MKAIFKYVLPVKDTFTISLPKNARILSVQTQHNSPVLWAQINTKNQKEARKFRLIGTGHPIGNVTNLKYIGTFQLDDGSFIGHLFEIIT
jgi:hypothetical protein